MSADIFIGTQGWNYAGWMGAFYPSKLPPKDLLPLYSRIFNTVEVDSTFYAIPAESAVRGWYEKTPADFKFSLKLPSQITHQNRLRDSVDILHDFSSRVLLLQEKLGCVLIQLPPDFPPSEHSALSRFLGQLPPSIHFAIELRDQKWISRTLIEEIEGHNASLALVDGKWISREVSFTCVEHFRSSFAYVRWMGPRELTDFSRIQIDRSKELQQWAEVFSTLRKRATTLYGYFNNHFQGHSPASANLFKNMIGQPITSPDKLIVQPSLF